MKTMFLLATLALSTSIGVFGSEAHFTYPVPDHPNWRQAIQHRTYELNQKESRQLAWGIAARFKGIDPSVRRTHHKYGMEIKLIFDDGTYDWFTPEKTFSPNDPGWQRLCGLCQPRRPVKTAQLFYRLATAGEAWYDGMTLFEVPDEPKRAPCRMEEKDGEITLENEFLSFSFLPGDGATARRLVDRKTGTNYAGEHINRRLFLDQFRQGGACYRRQWKAEVKKATADEVAVEVSMNGPQGYNYLDVRRLVSLKRDSAALDVTYAWHNQPASMGDLVIEPWVVNGLTPYGGANQQVMYPTAEGIRKVGPGGNTIKHRDVIGGWYAAGADDRRTMAFTFDWAHYAETWHYLAGNDNLMTDLILQPVKIAAGGTFTTDYAFFPLPGVKTPAWAENGIAAGIGTAGGKVAVQLDAARRGVFNAEVSAIYANGTTQCVRTVTFLSPDGTATVGGELPAEGLAEVALRLYSGGNLVFEADRSYAAGHVYRPKKAKAKPAEVKPFTLELKRDLVTPHAEFARPWAGGKPRVLFITSIHQAREIVELQQRVDIDARTVRLAFDENTTSWAMIERFGTYKYFDMNVSLKKELESRFDVIVVSDNLMDPVDKDNRALIEKQLAAGTGFVRIGKKNPALEGDKAAADWIKGNVTPWLLLEGAGNVRAADVGTHREVMLDYEARRGLTPFTGYQRQIKPTFRYQDYMFSVVARALFWAAKMDVKVPADAKVETETVPAGPGLNIRHTFWKGPKGVYDWKVETVPYKKAANLTKFAVDRDDFRIGEKVEGVAEADGGTVRVELVDGFGRLLAAADDVKGRFALAIPEARTGLLTVKACVMKDGAPADWTEKDVFCRIPYHRAEYPLCISEGWTTYSFEKEYLLQHRAKIYHELGINFIRYWESTRTDGYTHMLRHGFDLDFSIYDARIHGRNSFNETYLDPYSRTHDKKYLVRNPCLHDKAYREQLDAKTAAHVKRVAKFSPVTCDCGDENTLTRWVTPFDFCFSEHTLKAFREWLKGEYGTLDRLNAAWRTAFAAWDDVMPDTTIEARERAKRTGVKSYAAWADHRRFMELTFCGTIARVGEILHKELPGVPLDMSGTQAPNGWTGMDLWLISKVVEEPAAYTGGLLGDYVRSFGRPFVKPWTGYGVQPRTLDVWPWEVGFKFLDAGLYFWTCFNFLLPDYSPTPTAVKYGQVGDEMKSGAARLLRSLEYRHEVLLHYSYGSIHASRIEDRADVFDKCSLKWTGELRARGIPYRFVAYEEIENGELDRTTAKTLILPQSAAISDREAAAIERFAKRGGVVVGDEWTGIFDQHCSRRETPVLGGVVRRELDLGPRDAEDGVATYRMFARAGAEGRYWGFTRGEDAGEGLATRTVKLDAPAYVYDLREKKAYGKVPAFTVALGAAQAKFIAALPYDVGDVSVAAGDVAAGEVAKVTVKVGLPPDAKACHPVLVEVFTPDGKRSRLYSGVCDAQGGSGEYSFRTALNDPAGSWRIVATDYVTGKTAVASLSVRSK